MTSTIIEVFPQRIQKSIVLPIAGSIFLALLSKISIILPFSLVPITGQTFGILLLSLLFGRNMAFFSVIFYILEGISGIPVFAFGGGAAYLLGPTGGYIIGFLIASYIVGTLSDKGWGKNFFLCLFTVVIGEICIFLPGILHLLFFLPSNKILTAGLFPFIPGEIVKISLLFISYPSLWRVKIGKGSYINRK